MIVSSCCLVIFPLLLSFCLDMRYPFTRIMWFAVFVSFPSKVRGGVVFFLHCSHLHLPNSGCEYEPFAAFLAELHLGMLISSFQAQGVTASSMSNCSSYIIYTPSIHVSWLANISQLVESNSSLTRREWEARVRTHQTALKKNDYLSIFSSRGR